ARVGGAVVVTIGGLPGMGPCLSMRAGGEGVPVLAFREFFRLPIGPRGLEPTDRLLSLRDQRVRIQGYMVKEEEPQPGVFMLAPKPLAMAELADGPADDLPAATLFVHVGGEDRGKVIGYRAWIWTLSGVLRLGAWLEPNGRVSYVRLILDDLRAVQTSTTTGRRQRVTLIEPACRGASRCDSPRYSPGPLS